ncbi:MAG: FAD-linked oxidase C-terminal domain-containing protein, partial [Pseudomonadota bacterium]
KLFPLPDVMETAFIAVPDTQSALALVNLLQDRFSQQLSRCELMPESGLQMVLKHISGTRRPLANPSSWYVIIELAAGKEADLRETLNLCLAAGLEQGIITDAAIAETRQQRKDFWYLREAVSEAQREEGGSVKLDVSVPLARIPEFLSQAAETVERICSGARPIPFGHLGDGNIHYDICQPVSMNKKDYLARWDEIADPLHQIVLRFGGSIAAEHGVGFMKRGLIAETKSQVEMDLMRTIKKALDPHNLINPGKVV